MHTANSAMYSRYSITKLAMYFFLQVKSAYNEGDYDGALSASKQAKLWSIVGLVLGIVDVLTAIVVTIVVIVLAAAAAATAAAGFGEAFGDFYDFNNYQFNYNF